MSSHPPSALATARVQPVLARWRKLALIGNAVNAARGSVEVIECCAVEAKSGEIAPDWKIDL